MDLGSHGLHAATPRLPLCPLAGVCRLPLRLARALPVKRSAAKSRSGSGVIFFAERDDGAVLLSAARSAGLLGGMMESPSTEWGPAPPKTAGAAPLAA